MNFSIDIIVLILHAHHFLFCKFDFLYGYWILRVLTLVFDSAIYLQSRKTRNKRPAKLNPNKVLDDFCFSFHYILLKDPLCVRKAKGDLGKMYRLVWQTVRGTPRSRVWHYKLKVFDLNDMRDFKIQRLDGDKNVA